ncbi:MAG: ATP-dependent Clp protease ATP-binding subunit [Bacteroidales bacterium]|nr:ATP-dependent Clp protease ATP-binding subunit [Candidatus Physcousia equi]
MDKYSEYLSSCPGNVLHLAEQFAKDNKSPKIEPAHILRALLHKQAGLVKFIEDTLNEDYYYMLDWAEIRMQQCDKSPYGMKEPEYSKEAKLVIKEAENQAEQRGIQGGNNVCLLAAIVAPGVAFTADQLKTMPLKSEKVLATLGDAKASSASVSTGSGNYAPATAAAAENGYISPMLDLPIEGEIIGFDHELRGIVEVLARRDRANILIVGETGVGKTSLILGLIQRIKEQKVPASLQGLQPYELDLIALSQGVSYKGEIEDRFKAVAEQMAQTQGAVLVIENFHRVEDKTSTLNGVLPGLKKLLLQNQVQLIITSTVDGYTKDIEKDKELTAYFEKVQIDEPSQEQAVEILQSKCDAYSEYHHLPIEDEVTEEIVRLAKRYMPDKRLPSSAIDLLDRAMASVKVDNEMADLEGKGEKQEKLQRDAIRDIVSKMTGIPMGNIQGEERERLGNAEEILHQRVVGQDHACKSILDAVYESRSGLNKKGQPMGSFFFLGPTGTGKTELAKSLANFLFNDETAMLRFDMSEYKEEHSVALLYGAPPGYVGYEEGGLLVNQIRQHPYSVVLFDEIEKAHKSVFDLFLQILDEGKLHDRLGRVGDFSNALIIFTSNIGSQYIFDSFEANKIPTHDEMLEVMQGNFRPEFLARLTEIIPFSPITEAMINRIFDIHIKNLLKQLDAQQIKLEIDDTARKYVTQVGFNKHYGARPILGIIRKEIRRPLSKLIIRGDVKSGDTVTMKYDETNKQIQWDIDSPD